ncbi:hypothetical protein O7621_08400 [Solwaraspora sp. WMMD937]|uniref:hypothetical protein n=1 Tax=Solwaraspora sp. WMMD937 TaxID=3016090 RepID=UPI00249C9D17|nr:hypothetical protein [Solwaraspora sp. WMMD937]WFE23302.1 hypothetical protein O7621_08400 [Solwaraspora sp. WMMD937]
MIKADAVRLLIAQTARQALDTSESTYAEEGSLGDVLDTMSRFFLGRSLRSSARLYVEDPAEFDILIHDRMQPMVEPST